MQIRMFAVVVADQLKLLDRKELRSRTRNAGQVVLNLGFYKRNVAVEIKIDLTIYHNLKAQKNKLRQLRAN